MSKRGNGSGSIYRRNGKGPYYIEWKDHQDERQRQCTFTTDKATAERILAEKRRAAALRREGVIDAHQEQVAIESSKEIESHIVDFEAMLRGRQCGEKHIRTTVKL